LVYNLFPKVKCVTDDGIHPFIFLLKYLKNQEFS
jgi:hypothetical protein